MGYHSSFGMISSAINSIAEWTISTRNLISGCFHCQRNPDGCHNGSAASSAQDKAWFDCHQLQTDQPFCYTNPVALAEHDVISRAPNSSDKPPIIRQDDYFQLPKRNSGSFNEILRTDILDESCQSSKSNQKKRLYQNGVAEGAGKSDSISSNIFKNRSSKSFASQLEEEYFHKRVDLLLSGDSFSPARTRRSNSERFQKRSRRIKSPLMHRKSWSQNIRHLDDIDWDALASEDEEFDVQYEGDAFGDIWRTSEIQDIFEGFNTSAFNSYGCVESILRTNTGRLQETDKYEDIFPVHKNRKGTEKNKIVTPTENNSVVAKITKEENSLKENVINNDQLNEFIKKAIYEKNIKDIHDFAFKNKYFLICDNKNIYLDKSFNNRLIFDLVKEVFNECLLCYEYSRLICDNFYPEKEVQNKVMSVLRFNYKNNNDDDVISDDIKDVRNRLLKVESNSKNKKVPANLLIENVISSEILKEDKLWQNFSREEKETKEAVFNVIYDDLISREVFSIDMIFKKKIHNL